VNARLDEEVFFFDDPASRLRCVIAIDSATALPALGGCSLVADLDDADALRLALREAARTTRKLLLARLPCTGAHAVLLHPPAPFDRSALFAGFGRAVGRTRERFIAMQGDGATAQDMRVARRSTPSIADTFDATCLDGPEAEVAFGVFVAMEEALRRLGRRMDRSTVAVSGLAGAGMRLCERLHDAGAALVVADGAPALAHEASQRFGARVVDARDLPAQDCDVFAPCGAGALDAGAAARIAAPLVCGTADAPFADPRDRDLLHARGVVVLPDILVNAGALIAAAASRQADGRRPAWLQGIAGIGRRVNDLFDQMDGRAPYRLVDDWIDARRPGA